MRPALEALFETASLEDARAAVLSDERRSALRLTLNQTLSDRPIPDGQYADNLLQGLLALRMKFERAEAMHKLDLNLSMRSQRGSNQ
jgi:hypothetical protein